MANNELTFGEDEFIVSKTDLKGNITYGNSLFIKISGYEEYELLNKPHNILRHTDMPALIFTLLWERIRKGEEIFAYVKNKTKQGDFYWVFAHVTASLDASGQMIGFHSVRRRPTQEALSAIKPLYTDLLRIEKTGGVDASRKHLESILAQKGVNYDEFILSL